MPRNLATIHLRCSEMVLQLGDLQLKSLFLRVNVQMLTLSKFMAVASKAPKQDHQMSSSSTTRKQVLFVFKLLQTLISLRFFLIYIRKKEHLTIIIRLINIKNLLYYQTYVYNLIAKGIGGLNLSMDGPSKVDMECVEDKDGVCKIHFTPYQPGTYVLTILFSSEHVIGWNWIEICTF